MAGLGVRSGGGKNKQKTFSGGTGGEWGMGSGQGMGKWGGPPEKVWWPPVLLIFYLLMSVSITLYSILMDISFIIEAAQTILV